MAPAMIPSCSDVSRIVESQRRPTQILHNDLWIDGVKLASEGCLPGEEAWEDVVLAVDYHVNAVGFLQT